MNLAIENIIEHTNFIDPEPILRFPNSSKPLDPALADFHWFMPKVLFDSIAHFGSNACRCKTPKVVCGFRCYDDLEPHSG